MQVRESMALRDVHDAGMDRRSEGGTRTLSSSSSIRGGERDHSSSSDEEQDGDDDDDTHEIRRQMTSPQHRDDASGFSGADTDASVRPISPSSLAPSSFVSATNSNGSFRGTHRTYMSNISTKPTTLLSVDSSGANRIAVVPGTGGIGGASEMEVTTTVGGNMISPLTGGSIQEGPAITFSALPSTPPGSSSFLLPRSPSGGSSEQNHYPHHPQQTQHTDGTMNVPRHTLAHPRNNPHPASPPPDNASMLTLASSSFAPSFSHQSTTRSYSRSLKGFSGIRQSNLSIGGGNDADEDASVRALAPSRRASDESLGSRSTWSAAVLSNHHFGKTASLNTMDTGGDQLEQRGEEGDEREEIQHGDETEAQKMARQEGGKEVGLVGDEGKDRQVEGTVDDASVLPPAIDLNAAPDTMSADTPRVKSTSSPLIDSTHLTVINSTPSTTASPVDSGTVTPTEK